MTKDGWVEQDDYKRVMDGFNQAVEKKWVRARGVSCHSLPALRTAVASSWPEVHLVRINPQGKHMDDEAARDIWDEASRDIEPVVEQLKKMREKDRGVIGMKIFGNNGFKSGEDRDKSIRFAMSHPELNAIVIGFQATSEIDEAIKRMNAALADAA
jgi:predicted aldo/keto reductase-like oxidoreductase